MFNPLLADLTKIKNEQLEEKITELTKKFTIAARSGQGSVCQQIQIILESYRAEQQRRYDVEMKKQLKQNKNLDDFINIDN